MGDLPQPSKEGEPQTQQVLFLTTEGLQECPSEGCRGQAMTRTALRVHLFHLHVRYTVIILDVGNFSHPRGPCCDMLVPWQSLNGLHNTTTQCTREEETASAGGDEGEHNEGLPGLQKVTIIGKILQILGVNNYSFR